VATINGTSANRSAPSKAHCALLAYLRVSRKEGAKKRATKEEGTKALSRHGAVAVRLLEFLESTRCRPATWPTAGKHIIASESHLRRPVDYTKEASSRCR
jgi:hypothetical protein